MCSSLSRARARARAWAWILWLPATEEQATYHRGDGASSTASNVVTFPCCPLSLSSSLNKLYNQSRLCLFGEIPGCAAIAFLPPYHLLRLVTWTPHNALFVVLLRLATTAPASHPGPSPHPFDSALAIAAAPDCYSLLIGCASCGPPPPPSSSTFSPG